MNLQEPQWWKDILMRLNHLVSLDPTIFKIVSILADVFIFAYPILLIWLFIYGMKQAKKEFQYGSISIFISVVCSALITLGIQHFVTKARPESLPGLELILKHLPTISFPSDHATVSMAIAIGTVLVAKQMGWKRILLLGILLIDVSIIMSVSRVAVAIHRPTDIIAGWGIGMIWAWIGWKICQTTRVSDIFNTMIDWFNNHITDQLFSRK